MKLWKGTEVLWNGARCLYEFFQQDEHSFTVSITPFTAMDIKAPFMRGSKTEATRAQSVELVGKILVPFSPIPVSMKQLKDALNMPLVQRLPCLDYVWEALKQFKGATEVLVKSSSACPFDCHCYFCMSSAFAAWGIRICEICRCSANFMGCYPVYILG